MPIDRFYVDSELSPGTTVTLEGGEHHHLSHVMKKKEGQEIELINGKGTLSLAKITEILKKKSFLQIISSKTEPSPPPRLILAIPLMRPSKLEWVIEKGTELGSDAFFLFKADHSEKEHFSIHQQERVHNLCIAACKQSGRLYVPSIEVLPDLEAVFHHKALFLFGDTRKVPAKETPQNERIIFISGPERGFSEKELSLLDERATSFQLSTNILRAETAPIAAISLLGKLRF